MSLERELILRVILEAAKCGEAEIKTLEREGLNVGPQVAAMHTLEIGAVELLGEIKPKEKTGG